MVGKINRVFKKNDSMIILKKNEEHDENSLISDLAIMAKVINKTISVMIFEHENKYLLQVNKWNKSIMDYEFTNSLLAIISNEKKFIHKSSSEDEIKAFISEVSQIEKEKIVKNIKSSVDEKLIYIIVPCKDFCKLFEYGVDINSKNYIKINF